MHPELSLVRLAKQTPKAGGYSTRLRNFARHRSLGTVHTHICLILDLEPADGASEVSQENSLRLCAMQT